MLQTTPKKTVTEKFFAFDKIALVIGFVVDTVALISILLSIKLQGDNFTLPNFISPWLAFSIWVLGVYIYLALLNSYWRKNIESKQLARTFGGFLLKDLVFGFCSPFLSFLGLISLITLAWIASFEQGIFILLAATGYIVFISIMVKGMASIGEVNIEQDRKQKIDDNWEFVKKRIKSKLNRNQWISFRDMKDIAVLWNIDADDFVYALAKYAAENPTTTTFGEIHDRKDGEKISGDYPVLINLKEINDNKYYYSG